MASFTKGGAALTPFGPNEYLRSTKGQKTEPYTLAASTVPARTIDGVAGQKILKRGTVLAKITSGADSGKVGPFQAGAVDGRADTANIVGLNNTFLPWQLMERDVEVAATYECSAVQAWCIELDAGGAEIALTNATRDAMRSGNVGVSILFH